VPFPDRDNPAFRELLAGLKATLDENKVQTYKMEKVRWNAWGAR
jgi:hypothetical protein